MAPSAVLYSAAPLPAGNDNHAPAVLWDERAEPVTPAKAAPSPASGWRHHAREAAGGLAGAIAAIVAILCLTAH